MWALLFCPQSCELLANRLWWEYYEADLNYRRGNKPYKNNKESIERWNRKWK